jgi:hypothetical protein
MGKTSGIGRIKDPVRRIRQFFLASLLAAIVPGM